VFVASSLDRNINIHQTYFTEITTLVVDAVEVVCEIHRFSLRFEFSNS
jgi:hypothetical protein